MSLGFKELSGLPNDFLCLIYLIVSFSAETCCTKPNNIQKQLFSMVTYNQYISVSIATRHGLDGPGIESRCGARFSAPVQTGPEAHSSSYTIGTLSFPEVKRPGRGVDHPSHLAPRLKKE